MKGGLGKCGLCTGACVSAGAESMVWWKKDWHLLPLYPRWPSRSPDTLFSSNAYLTPTSPQFFPPTLRFPKIAFVFPWDRRLRRTRSLFRNNVRCACAAKMQFNCQVLALDLIKRSVAVDWSSCAGLCGLIAVDRALWVGRSGSVAVVRSLYINCCKSIVVDWSLFVGCSL